MDAWDSGIHCRQYLWPVLTIIIPTVTGTATVHVRTNLFSLRRVQCATKSAGVKAAVVGILRGPSSGGRGLGLRLGFMWLGLGLWG